MRVSLLIQMICCVFAVNFPISGYAQANQSGGLKDLSLEELSNIEVTSVSKEPEEVRATPAAVYVITQNDIRTSGVTSIPDALRLAPGVEVDQIDSAHWAIGIRGFESQFSRSVLVLIDGRSVYTPLFAGVFWDVQNTPMSDIDRIEIIRGPGGTIWGANAFNGVINIITLGAKDTHGERFAAGGGNLDQATGDYRYGSGNGTSLDYRIYGRYFDRSPEYHTDNRRFDDWRMGQSGFRMDWNRGPQNTLTVQGDIYKGISGEQTQVASFTPPSEVLLDGNDQVSGGNVLAHWIRELDGGSGFQVQAYYDRTNRTAPHFKETRDTFDIDFISHRNLGSRNNVLLGLGGRVSPSTLTQEVPTLDFTPHQQTDTIYSSFIQDDLQIVSDKVSLTSGVKLEHNNYTGFEVQPSVRLMWTLSTRQSAWAAVTRAVRTPSRLDTDLQLDGFLLAAPLLYLQIKGNPNFESETLVGYEIGYRRLVTPGFYVDIATFHNDYGKLSSMGALIQTIQAAPVPHILWTFPYANGIKGSADGFEIAPDWKPSTTWQLKSSYSYVRLDLRNEPGNTDTSTLATDEGSTPRHRVVVQSLFKLPGRIEFNQTYRYASSLPAQAVGAYSTADSRFAWQLRKGIEFSLTGRNLLQPHHDEFGRSPGPLVGTKRSVYAGITWTR